VVATDVNGTVVKVVNADEVAADEVSAVAFVNAAEVVEASNAAEVVSAPPCQ